MVFTAGIARTDLTPFWGVELTGWGYYIERKWQRVHDPLHATAVVFDDGQRLVCIITLDLMIISTAFTRLTREMVSRETGIAPAAILLTATHSHNAPASGGLLGVGEVDPLYEAWACRQAATAAILAWRDRHEARLRVGHTEVNGITFNRTRTGGPVDPRLTLLRIDKADGSPLGIVVNFQAHPTVHTGLRPFDVSRDVPGEICDYLEDAVPGAKAIYLQGACGDVNFLRSFSTPERCQEPARLVAKAAIDCLPKLKEIKHPTVSSDSAIVSIPTRRWLAEEIQSGRAEAERRLQTNDAKNWEATIGRSMTNNPRDMVARHGGDELKAVRAMCRFQMEWTDRMLLDWEHRPEVLETEVQAMRIGDLCVVANSAEFFTTLALDLRQRSAAPELMIACYANGRIGYMPDAHDIALRTYAGYQSPKYCNQFPFTDASGPALVEGMLARLKKCKDA